MKRSGKKVRSFPLRVKAIREVSPATKRDSAHARTLWPHLSCFRRQRRSLLFREQNRKDVQPKRRMTQTQRQNTRVLYGAIPRKPRKSCRKTKYFDLTIYWVHEVGNTANLDETCFHDGFCLPFSAAGSFSHRSLHSFAFLCCLPYATQRHALWHASLPEIHAVI